MQLCKMQFCSKMLHGICISQAGESWKIWVPAAPTGAGGGNQGLKQSFHCRANQPLASVLLVATATLSSWVFQVRKMGFGDPGRPKNVTYNIPVKSTFHMYAADYSSFFEHGEHLG